MEYSEYSLGYFEYSHGYSRYSHGVLRFLPWEGGAVGRSKARRKLRRRRRAINRQNSANADVAHQKSSGAEPSGRTSFISASRHSVWYSEPGLSIPFPLSRARAEPDSQLA